MSSAPERRTYPQARLHVVSGKGGTGKTTVSVALALSLARDGRRVLLVEVEGRQGIARLIDVPPLSYTESSLTIGHAGGEVFGLAVEPTQALMEYLEKTYRAGPVAAVLKRTGAVEFVTTIAPGLRDVLLTGKVYEAVKRRRRTRDGDPFVYDAVVLDAPPTGRVGHFLNVNSEVSGLAKVGPIHTQAESIMKVLRSGTTVVHLVTLLEEMPVQETQDAVAELSGLGLQVGSVIVNQAVEPTLSRLDLAAAEQDRLDREAVMASLVGTGIIRSGNEHTARSVGIVEALMAQARDHAAQVRQQAEQRTLVREVGRPVVDLPYLPEGVDLGGLYVLADELHRQGLR